MNLYTKIKTWLGRPWPTALNVDRAFIQVGHVVGGYAIVLTGYHFYPHLWLAPLLVNAWAGPKEFWFDYRYEDAATRGSSPLDFSMYNLGLLLAMLVLR
jgi:hypothetical protein